MTLPDVVIIGAGVVGAACAFYAAHAGLSVTVLDRGPIGGGTTGIGQGAALASDKPPGPALDLAIDSLRRWHELAVDLGPTRLGLAHPGALAVAGTERDLAALTALAVRQRARNLDAVPVPADELPDHEPMLAAGLAGGVYYPDDLRVDPVRATAHLLRASGAEVRCGVDVRGIELAGGQRVAGVRTAGGDLLGCAAVVNAAGAWAGEISAMVGTPLPVTAREGFVLVTEALTAARAERGTPAPRRQPPNPPSPHRQPPDPPGRRPLPQGAQPPPQPPDPPSPRPLPQPPDLPGTQPAPQPSDLPGTQPARQPPDLPGTQPERQPPETPSPPTARPLPQPGARPLFQPGARPLRQTLYAPGAGTDLGSSIVVTGGRAGSVLIGANRERLGVDRSWPVPVLRELASRAVALLPALAGVCVLRVNRGFRPGTPDELPIIGPDMWITGLYHACGHAGSGVCLAPATGALTAQLLTGAVIRPPSPPSMTEPPFLPEPPHVPGQPPFPGQPTFPGRPHLSGTAPTARTPHLPEPGALDPSAFHPERFG